MILGRKCPMNPCNSTFCCTMSPKCATLPECIGRKHPSDTKVEYGNKKNLNNRYPRETTCIVYVQIRHYLHAFPEYEREYWMKHLLKMLFHT